MLINVFARLHVWLTKPANDARYEDVMTVGGVHYRMKSIYLVLAQQKEEVLDAKEARVT